MKKSETLSYALQTNYGFPKGKRSNSNQSPSSRPGYVFLASIMGIFSLDEKEQPEGLGEKKIINMIKLAKLSSQVQFNPFHNRTT